MIDIDKLEAGRELDTLVAEMVLKWHIHSDVDEQLKFNPHNDKECSYCIDEPPEDCPPELRAIAKQIICRRVPDFSTDIAAAWEIEEELKKRGLAGKYAESLWNEVGEIYHGKDFGEFVFAIIHATPLQRCRAALKAVTW